MPRISTPFEIHDIGWFPFLTQLRQGLSDIIMNRTRLAWVCSGTRFPNTSPCPVLYFIVAAVTSLAGSLHLVRCDYRSWGYSGLGIIRGSWQTAPSFCPLLAGCHARFR